jgi:hypothetical protein
MLASVIFPAPRKALKALPRLCEIDSNTEKRLKSGDEKKAAKAIAGVWARRPWKSRNADDTVPARKWQAFCVKSPRMFADGKWTQFPFSPGIGAVDCGKCLKNPDKSSQSPPHNVRSTFKTPFIRRDF